MAGVECITLDTDQEDEEEDKSSNVSGSRDNAEPCDIRCNFCPEQEWLSLDSGDPIDHRVTAHASALFYCDTCRDDERGASGFETYAEVKNHVIKKHGIQAKDTNNLHKLIRIPGDPDLLKMFRCTFCISDGFKFVGMTEEDFLEHVVTTHGLKAARRRPDKLRRECRLCLEISHDGGMESRHLGFSTDAELARHVTRNHLEEGGENRFPFAGFGPRKVNVRRDSLNSKEMNYFEVNQSRSGPSGISKKS